MEDMRYVAERLVIRCNEAVMQLELSIQRKMCEFDPNNSHCFIQVQEYYSFLARLSSLKLRAEHVQESLRHQRKDPNDVCIEYETLEKLIYEFQDITMSLNEVARAYQSPTKSARSGSSKESSVIPLKTLKIIERNRDSLIGTSPMKKSLSQLKKEEHNQSLPAKRNVRFQEDDLDILHHLHSVKRANSLPGSPMPDTLLESQMFSREHKTLRMAKSYDVGLNGRAKKNADWEFFKNKNRLSLSVFDDVNTDASDEETVISVSPPNISYYLSQNEDQYPSKQVRRCNSHESILSRKILSPSTPANLIMRPTYQSVWQKKAIVTKPTISCSTSNSTASPTIGSPHLSKDMLSQFVTAPPSKKYRGWFSSSNSTPFASSIFQKWFNSDSLVTKEIGNPDNSSPSSGRPIVENRQRHSSSNSYSTSIVIGPNGAKFIRGLNDPLVTCTVSYNELQEALNTEFNF
ncbi:Vac17p [Kluyveromyces lactis]|uniref:KLLA0C00462p n=1 Tax=Kluyveromyces lactis (strain ATCC 8585 / CBS 2359 / DSM 70799 / NBRC 1267 / NRRL Y-1140 / WM37) TaxID=284590 RepID=Q6CV25_KLULA|nr:uncharacterized protein KLLA0_C00462g [Kluyveromyces lactis]CAH01065.1 KLLA0C00462p [Kluyveromyces lactis]|eukprot:XP_452214.1 uncharacterized protein KLLA0_C00462g [Kluyveromyces lactis]